MSNPEDRFAIIPIPPGPAPSNSLMVGPRDLIMQNLPDTRARADAIEQLEISRIKADQISTMQNVSRALQVVAFADSITHMTRRLDRLETRRTEKARRDAEEHEREEQQKIEAALSKLPDPDNPPPFSDETHHPSGDLHTLEPSEPEDLEELEASDQGTLPKELTEKVPGDPGTDPDLSGSKEPSARNPVGISW